MKKPSKTFYIVAAAVLCPVLVILLVVNVALNRINRTGEWESLTDSDYEAGASAEEDAEGYKKVDENEIDWGEYLDINMSGNSFNVLLVGADNDENNTSRSDTMILCNINLDAKKITLISFLRDLYVQIPDHKDNRLNAAYSMGGIELLDATLEQNFGVTADANVIVDFEAFQKIIDIIGGVDIYVFQDECNIINSSVPGAGLKEGYCHLNGDEALVYCRIRHLDSDFGRTERQRKLLTCIFTEFKNITMGEALDIIGQVFPLVTTDMTNAEMIDYAIKLLPTLRSCSIEPVHIPADGTWENANIRGMAVLLPDFTKNRELLQKIMEQE